MQSLYFPLIPRDEEQKNLLLSFREFQFSSVKVENGIIAAAIIIIIVLYFTVSWYYKHQVCGAYIEMH